MARSFKGKAFTKILRGYSPEEVDEYIAYIEEEYKKLEKSHGEKSRRLSLALSKLDEMNNYAEELENQLDEQTKESEEVIAKQKHQLFLAAKQLEKFANQPAAADPTVAEKAKQEAEMIVADAQLKGEKIIAEAEEVARNLREKIITEATARAERIVVEAEQSVSGNSQVADDMSLAAVDIYNEICAFRDTLFAAYNTHIESIEEITAAAGVLLSDAGGEGGLSYDEEDDEADEADETDEEELFDEDSDFVAPADFDVVDDEEEIEPEDEVFEPAEKPADEPTDEPADEADYEIVDDESDFYVIVDSVNEEADPAPVADDNGFVELVDEEDDDVDDAGDIWAEYFDTTVDEPAVEEEEEIPAPEVDEPAPEEAEEVAPVEDTYESYEVYGEAVVEESDESIELEAQKYSDVYTDDFDDYEEDDGSYAPNDELAWGDDMYAEVEEEPNDDSAQADFETVSDFEEEFADAADFDEDYTDDFALPVEAEDFAVEADDEIDELDKLKQFFSANYDEDLAKSRVYDTASNSTTSIALSLNDFFEEDEEMVSEFSLDDGADVGDLFEKLDDPMSVTDEFNIIFGHMDDGENIAEIKRQPIVPAEEPKNPKKHGKF